MTIYNGTIAAAGTGELNRQTILLLIMLPPLAGYTLVNKYLSLNNPLRVTLPSLAP